MTPSNLPPAPRNLLDDTLVDTPPWHLMLQSIDVGSGTAVEDARNYAAGIVSSSASETGHWDLAAAELIAATALYLLRNEQSGGPAATLHQIETEWTDSRRSLVELWREMLRLGESDPVVAAAGIDMLAAPDVEAAAVVACARRHINNYARCQVLGCRSQDSEVAHEALGRSHGEVALPEAR